MDGSLEYDEINLDHQGGGRLKLVKSGIGWKDSANGKVVTIKSGDFKNMSWARCVKEYQLQITLMDGTVHEFNGFPKEACEKLSEFCNDNYSMDLHFREHCLRGLNIGKAGVSGFGIEFSDIWNGKSVFDIPISKISNVYMPSKNEVTVEITQPQYTAVNSKIDHLMDVRFTVSNPPAGGDADQTNSVDSTTEFYNKIKECINTSSAALGVDAVVDFQELHFIVPRGRYETSMYSSLMRLRGKSYDYKIPYSNVLRIFILPRLDDLNMLVAVHLEPPLRQGQTRYPFLIIQMPRSADTKVSIHLPEDMKESLKSRLQQEQKGPLYDTFGNILSIFSEKEVIRQGSFSGHHDTCGLKCSTKANEGYLYPLHGSFIFFPKPATFIDNKDISTVVFSRVDRSIVNSKTFDLKFILHSGEIVFSNISREELGYMESFLRDSGIKFQSEAISTTKYELSSSDDEPVSQEEEDEHDSYDDEYDEYDDSE